MKSCFDLLTISCVSCTPACGLFRVGCGCLVVCWFFIASRSPCSWLHLCLLRAHLVTLDGFRVSPVSHTGRWSYLTNVDFIDMSDQLAFHMPWLWRVIYLPFMNSWRRSSAILDYVNSMLTHAKEDDPIGLLCQFNVCSLIKCIFIKQNRALHFTDL